MAPTRSENLGLPCPHERRDLTLIMDKLNHNSLAYTKRYLGITDDELGDVEFVATR